MKIRHTQAQSSQAETNWKCEEVSLSLQWYTPSTGDAEVDLQVAVLAVAENKFNQLSKKLTTLIGEILARLILASQKNLDIFWIYFSESSFRVD